MKRCIEGVATLCGILLLGASPAGAANTTAPSNVIPYNGTLNSGGAPLSANVILHVEIYDGPDPTTATRLWFNDFAPVMVAAGHFSILLGENKPLTGVFGGAGTGGQRFLRFGVEAYDNSGTATGTVVWLDGMQLLAAVPYAYSGAPGEDFSVDHYLGVGTASPQAPVDVAEGETYLIDRYIGNSCTIGDPPDYYILLHRAYTNTPINDHYVFGQVVATRGSVGAWNYKTIVDLDTASAYQSNHAYVSCRITGWSLNLVTYAGDGQRYVALRPPTGLSCQTSIVFTGFAYASDGELLKMVPATDISNAAAMGGTTTVTAVTQ